ncbi:MAG: PAS domain S-box protein [Chloroflexi bacterium]|nr:PAS domain S-box protein [Chloroflexota bacterium]
MAYSPLTILLIEDNPGDARLIREMLAEATAPDQAPSFRLIHADRLAAGLTLLAQGTARAVLLDLSLPDSQGLDTFLRVRAAAPEMPVVVLTGLGDEATALKAIQTGAQDYLVKGQVDGNVLGQAVRYAIERQGLSRALRKSEEQYRLIVETAQEGIWQIDADSQTTFVNRRMADMLGYTVDEMTGAFLFDFMDEEGWQIAAAHVERRRQGIAEQHDFKFRRKDGADLWAMLSTNPLLGDDGRYLGALAMVANITERKQAEAARARRERELATLYATSLELNSQSDLVLLLPTIVQRAAELAGATMGGLYLLRDDGQSLELVVSHNLPQNYVGAVLQLGEGLSGRIAQTGEPLTIEDYDRWPGRSTVYAGSSFHRVLGVPLKVQNRVIGVLNVTDDRRTGAFDQDQIRFVHLFADQAAIAIENARLYEQVQRHAADLEARVAERTAELRIANERLIGLERLKSQFITNASHELRTPVTNIKTSLYLLERGKPEKREKYMTTLNNETELLQSLLDDLLDAASLDFGRTQPALAPVDLGLLLARLVETRVALVAERNLRLDLVADPATPLMLADAMMLRQAIKALLLDIADHEATGSRIVLYAQPFTAAGRAWGALTAGGDAPAPTPEEQARLFALASAEEKTQGSRLADTNLRLAVCREIIARHGGYMAVQPRAGRSSIVTLWLPAAA